MKVSGPDYSQDFLIADLICGLDAFDTGHYTELCARMEMNMSESYKPLESITREGLFDNTMLYKVFEPDDIKEMIRILSRALTLKHP